MNTDMSRTPVTDAFFFRTDIDWDMEVDFARRLESQLEEMTLRWERTNDALFDERALADRLAEALRELLYYDLQDVNLGRIKSSRDALTAWKEARK